MFNFDGLGMRILRESSPKPRTALITKPEEAIALVKRELRGETREVVVLILLNAVNRVLGIAVNGIGTADTCMIHPREIFLPAIAAGAIKIIIAHNHPSGNFEPSQQDIEIAKRLCEAGELLGIPVLDFLVITPKKTLSFKGARLI